MLYCFFRLPVFARWHSHITAICPAGGFFGTVRTLAEYIAFFIGEVMKSNLIISSSVRSIAQLSRLQGLPLQQKINLSQRRIQQFNIEQRGKVYVSFSGGKDSTVLLHLVRSMYPNTQAVFLDTGVEYPEIVSFVNKVENVITLRPKMAFKKVLETYGFPMVSKEVSQKIYEIQHTNSDKLRNKRLNGDQNGNGKLAEKWKYLISEDIKISHNCCNILKKTPAKKYEKESGNHPYIGDMAAESRLRKTNWLLNGCNSFKTQRPTSRPLSFWNETDIWKYITLNSLEVSDIYKTEARTGCMYCLFGCQFDDTDGARRFDRMKTTHPKHYAAAEKMGIISALNLIRPVPDSQAYFYFAET